MGKKITRSQKIGDLGESIFETFALKNGLIPNKVKRDYGIDFVCQPTERSSFDGISHVKSSLLGVNVRSCSQRRARVKYSKDDITQILKTDFPALLVLVDVENEVVYHRFLDIDLLKFFHYEIAQGKQSITMTPTKMNHGDYEFQNALAQVMEAKNQQKLRLCVMQHRLSQLIGPSRLSIQRSSEGSFAVVEVFNFEEIFKNQEDKIKSTVREIILSTRLDRGFSLPLEQINRAIVHELGDYVEKTALFTRIPSKPETLFVKCDDNVVECLFEVRKFGDEISFYHIAGLSIIFSGPRKEEDSLYYHHFDVKYNDPASEPLFNHKELVNFLKNCKENATLHLGDINSIAFELNNYPMLFRLGLIVSALERIYDELKIDNPILKLSHIYDINYNMAFGLLCNLFDPDLKENLWPGFRISSDDKHITEVDGKILCPAFFTLPEGMFIIKVAFIGKIALLGENNAIGFRFDKYLSMVSEGFEEFPDKSIHLPKFPLILICEGVALEIREREERGWHIVKYPFDLGISYIVDK
jgi:hypothetical protein